MALFVVQVFAPFVPRLRMSVEVHVAPSHFYAALVHVLIQVAIVINVAPVERDAPMETFVVVESVNLKHPPTVDSVVVPVVRDNRVAVGFVSTFLPISSIAASVVTVVGVVKHVATKPARCWMRIPAIVERVEMLANLDTAAAMVDVFHPSKRTLIIVERVEQSVPRTNLSAAVGLV